jgi:hypothetical protein
VADCGTQAGSSFEAIARPRKTAAVYSAGRKWFEQDRWVQNANARFRDGQRLLFFNDYELENNSHSIAISPVALLWQQDNGEQPITATADSAQLNSSSAFDMQQGKFGKIVSGFLAGDVHIAGPDGLKYRRQRVSYLRRCDEDLDQPAREVCLGNSFGARGVGSGD